MDWNLEFCVSDGIRRYPDFKEVGFFGIDVTVAMKRGLTSGLLDGEECDEVDVSGSYGGDECGTDTGTFLD